MWRYPEGTPAVVAGQTGQGRCIYMGPEVGAAYYRNSYPYLRSMMAEAVGWAAGEPPRVMVDAPLVLQATFFEQPSELFKLCQSYGGT